MPSHIVDGRRAVIQPVSQRGDLVKWSSLSKLCKRPVNVCYSLFSRNNTFTIQLQNILEYTVRGRVRRSQVQRGGLFFNRTIRKCNVLVGHWLIFRNAEYS